MVKAGLCSLLCCVEVPPFLFSLACFLFSLSYFFFRLGRNSGVLRLLWAEKSDRGEDVSWLERRAGGWRLSPPSS
jgi:hypothetical protein